MKLSRIAHIRATPVTVPPAAPLLYSNGAIKARTGPGLGVTLDRNKLAEYHELFKKMGGYTYDRDPSRPGRYPLVPNTRWKAS